MEDTEELLVEDGEAAEKDVAAITITLDDEKLSMPLFHPKY